VLIQAVFINQTVLLCHPNIFQFSSGETNCLVCHFILLFLSHLQLVHLPKDVGGFYHCMRMQTLYPIVSHFTNVIQNKLRFLPHTLKSRYAKKIHMNEVSRDFYLDVGYAYVLLFLYVLSIIPHAL